MKNKTLGSLYGFVLADALGVPVEFSTRKEREKDPVWEMRGHGTYDQPAGTWSDDTSLTLALIDTILKGYDLDLLAKNFITYLSGNYTPYGELFDIGIGTRNSILNMQMGMDPVSCGGKDERSNGNGSLMRILPLVFYTKDMDFEQKMKVIADCSSLTHAHEVSIFACQFYVCFAQNLLKGMNKQEAYEATISLFPNYPSVYQSIMDKTIVSRNVSTISSSGYVVHTLEAVLYCFLKYDNYNDIVFHAINLGEDTDTVGAIVGGLAGLYYGYDSLNKNWIKQLANKEVLDQYFNAFVEYIESK
ncbi:MAG: ADP-ribosylglycohydrolase family protein [Firmicutes bacterium]|nr:ADP-ribosylglycohydrolase family protein [Bacillota bacterium]